MNFISFIYLFILFQIPRDKGTLQIQSHKLAAAFYSTIFLTITTLIIKSVFLFLRNIIRIILTYYTQNLGIFAGYKN